MSIDHYFSFAALFLTGFAICAYTVRVLFSGRASHSRIDRDGESFLLGKGLKEMGYWAIHPIARFFIRLHITANTVSYLSIPFGLIAGIALSQGYFGAATLFAMVSFLFDAVDGIVARLTGEFSDSGEVLDASIDRYVEFFFIGGLIIYYRFSVELQSIALLALLGSFMVSYSTAKAEAMQVEPPRGSMRRTERAAYLTLGALLSSLTTTYWEQDLFGYPMVIALAIVALFSNVSAVTRLYLLSEKVKNR